MLKKKRVSQCSLILILVVLSIISSYSGVHAEGSGPARHVVRKEERRPVVSSEYGEISAVRISDGINGSYLLHFFKLESNSMFLPVFLNAHMFFYVHSGIGRLSWVEEDELRNIDIRPGDVYRLQQGTLFFVHCYSRTHDEQQTLQIHAIFTNSDHDLHEPATGTYSSVQEIVLGFDKTILKATFKVSDDVLDELLNGTKLTAIVHVDPECKMEAQLQRSLAKIKSYNVLELNEKKKKKKDHKRLFNLFNEDKDFKNCNGWITTVTRRKLSALKGFEIGLFMVKLNPGSMMAPHWNSMGTEIAVVLEGRGMVRAVCSDLSEEMGTKNMRFEVEESDVFTMPRFHTMAQIAFNNETFVFLGFSSMTETNRPRFLGGESSILRNLDKDVLAVSLNVTTTTVDELLAPHDDSIIVACTSCAEKEFQNMQEETEEREEEKNCRM